MLTTETTANNMMINSKLDNSPKNGISSKNAALLVSADLTSSTLV
jgi:hypothetical protein